MKVTLSSSANCTNITNQILRRGRLSVSVSMRYSGSLARSTTLGFLLLSFCTEAEAARVMVPAFRLVPRSSSNVAGADSASSVFGQQVDSTSEAGATFDCTADLADLVASTADDCLKLSSFCLMSALIREGQECAVDPDGGDDSVMVREGVLDVASVMASSVIDSDNIQTECLKPTLESAQCLALMQGRLNNASLTVVGLEYIPLSEPTATPPPVKIDLSSPSPVATALSPSTISPATSPPVASVPPPSPVPTAAPSTSPVSTLSPTASPLQNIVEMVPTALPVVKTSAPVTFAPQTKPQQPTLPNRDSTQSNENSSVDTEISDNGSTDNENMGVIIGTVVGASIFAFLLGNYLRRRRSRNHHTKSNSGNHDTEALVTDGVTISKTTQPLPPKEIDIEKGRSMDETEDDNSGSSNRLRQEDGNDLWDEPWSLASRSRSTVNQRQKEAQKFELERRVDTSDDDDDDDADVGSKQNYVKAGDDDYNESDVPEYDEILSTGSSSLAYTLGSGTSSTSFSGTGGGGTDTTAFDGDTFKSVNSVDLMTTIQTIMEQHQVGQSHGCSPTSPSCHDLSGTNESDSSSVVSQSTIESEDPELALGHRMFQPHSWLTRTDRLVPAAQQAAAAVASPETSQADF